MKFIFKVQSEFFVQTTTKNVLIDNHCKLFTNQSETSALPIGCSIFQGINDGEIRKFKLKCK